MDWLNLILMLTLAAGNTELLVSFVNRTHGLKINCGWLRHIRHIHDLALLLFPVLFFVFVGLRGPGLIWGGSWSDLSIWWKIYVALCACGVAGLVNSMIRWWCHRNPKCVTSTSSTVVDIVEQLQSRPLMDGPFFWMTRFPLNEIFQVEYSEKDVVLPRLPREWDGLTVLHLSDFHFIGTVTKPFFERALTIAMEKSADLVVFTGDLLDDPKLIEWFPDTLGQLDATLGRFYVLGNHDWEIDPPRTRNALDELGWTDVGGKTTSLQHANSELVIGGSECPWMGNPPDFSADNVDTFRILLSHTPDNFNWAIQQGVDLILSGHNHGGQVVLPVVGPVYAPSIHGVRYAGGAFWQSSTFLHVNRGLSGRYPLRWRCFPEISRLVLRSSKTT